jgi:hypothetical protein
MQVIKKSRIHKILLPLALFASYSTVALACMLQPPVPLAEVYEYAPTKCGGASPLEKKLSTLLSANPRLDAETSVSSGEFALRSNIWHRGCSFDNFRYFGFAFCTFDLPRYEFPFSTYVSVEDLGSSREHLTEEWCFRALQTIADAHVREYNSLLRGRIQGLPSACSADTLN